MKTVIEAFNPSAFDPYRISQTCPLTQWSGADSVGGATFKDNGEIYCLMPAFMTFVSMFDSSFHNLERLFPSAKRIDTVNHAKVACTIACSVMRSTDPDFAELFMRDNGFRNWTDYYTERGVK